MEMVYELDDIYYIGYVFYLIFMNYILINSI